MGTVVHHRRAVSAGVGLIIEIHESANLREFTLIFLNDPRKLVKISR